MNPLQLMQMVQQLRANPSAILGQFGIPSNMMNDPQAVVQQLMNQGSISQAQYNQAVSMAKSMGIKI